MSKLFIYGGITVGSLLGGWIGSFWGGWVGFPSIALGFVGCFFGLWAGYKLNQNFGD